MIVVMMGVSGSGKTTVGELLAKRLGWSFHDADDFHSAENKAKMHAGIPLTDEDRKPWLASLQELLRKSDREGASIVLACSALKEQFRRDLKSAARDVRIVYLKGSFELISERLKHRNHPFMNPALLASQFEALEEPTDAIVVDDALPPEQLVEEIIPRITPAKNS